MISNAELIFEEERAAATTQLSLADNGLAVGQYVRLIHEVRRQEDDLAMTTRLQE